LTPGIVAPVANEPGADSAYHRFRDWDEEPLLQIVGAAALTPAEQAAAALQAFAPDDLLSAVEVDGLFGLERAVDLVARGRQALGKAVAARRDQLRDSLCPLYGQVAERELVFNAIPILADGLSTAVLHTGVPVATAVASALIMVKYGLDELCAGTG
jgi:hypothetical protein